MIRIVQLDHLVMTVQNIKRTCLFYSQVLGMEVVHFGDNRTALNFGSQKINLHEQGNEFEPKAAHPQPGTMDLCLLTDESTQRIIEHLGRHNVRIVEGPVQRTGATGPIQSVYIRDPDNNLLEIATPLQNLKSET